MTASTAHHRERWRGVARTFGASVASRLLAAGCALLQVPIALRQLGEQAYGFWMTLTGTWALLAVFDLGLGLALQNEMAAAFGRGERAAMKGLLLAGGRQLAQLAAPLALLLVPLAWAVDWPAWFHLEEATLRAGARGAMAAVALGFCINLPLTLAARLAAAAQMTWLPPLWACGGSVVLLAGVGLAAWSHASFGVFLLLSLVVPLVQNLGLGLHVWRALEWPGLAPVAATRAQTQRVFRQGLRFFAPQAGILFVQSGLPAAVAIVSGPAMVTQFNLLQRLLNLVAQTQGMVLMPFWPAYAEAQARGDAAWIRKSFRFSVAATLPFVALAGAIGAAGGWLVRLWLGARAPDIAPAFAALNAGWIGALMIGQPFSLLLGGLGHATGMALYGTLAHVLSIGAMFYLGPRLGATGVLWSVALAYVLVNLPCTIGEASWRLRRFAAAGARTS